MTAAEVAGRIPLVELRANNAKKTDPADKSCLEINCSTKCRIWNVPWQRFKYYEDYILIINIM